MTNEEAKAFLIERIDFINREYPEIKDYKEALEIAVKVLDRDTCEGCIKRIEGIKEKIRGGE